MKRFSIFCAILMMVSGCVTDQQMIGQQLAYKCGRAHGDMTDKERKALEACYQHYGPVLQQQAQERATAANPATYGGAYPAYQATRRPVTFTDCNGIGNSISCTSY